MLGVDLDDSRRQTDRLDDHRDDQRPSDRIGCQDKQKSPAAVVNPLTRSVSSPDADHGAGSRTCAMDRFQVLASKRRRWPVSGASSRRFMTSDASARISGRAWRA
jgi:hypothetical protein